MILRKAPSVYKHGDSKTIIKFAFIPTKLIKRGRLDPITFEQLPDIIGEIIWLERYIETYFYNPQYNTPTKKNVNGWIFLKSERYDTAFLNKLCK